MAPRFVISSYTFLPDIGGVATYNLALARALAENGFDVTVVTSTPGNDVQESFRLYRRPSIWRMLRLYATADFVYLSNLSLKLGWPLLFSRKRYGLGHHSVSAFDTQNAPRGLKGWLEQLVAGRLVKRAVHFPCSHFVLNEGKAVLGGMPAAVLYPIAHDWEMVPQSLAEYRARKDVFFAGRLVEEKGVGFLVSHWPEIRNVLGVNTLRIAGDGAARADVEAQATGMDGIEFLGSQPLDKVTQGMREAAYVMTPSIWEEPFGIVGVEGLAAGAVVISSDRGGLREAVGDLGVVFQFEDPASFTDALRQARALREKTGASAKALEAYRERVRMHLARFSKAEAVAIVKTMLGHEHA